MKHVVTIPDWLPPRLNQVRGRHWRAEYRAKKQAAEIVGAYAQQASVPRAKGRRRISLTITLGKGHRQPDRDAYDKVLLDALKRAGLILDDSDRGLEGRMEVEFSRGPTNRTEIFLEDIEN